MVKEVSARSRAGGFTLVELMIAIALMLVIVLQLQIIFNGSRVMFRKAEALVEVFQNARNAVDLLERDLANAVATDQMEFFNDIRNVSMGIGFFNGESEIHPELRNSFFENAPYVYGFAMLEPEPYTPRRAIEGGPYRRDRFYLRTYTPVQGVAKEALVEWSLWTGPPGEEPRSLPILQRRVVDVQSIGAGGALELRKHPAQDVCYYVQEFKVEAFLRDRSFPSIGRFYSPREAAQGGSTDTKAPNLARRRGKDPGSIGVMCVERGEGLLSTSEGTMIVTDTENKPLQPLQAIAPGDRIYVVTQPISGQTFQTDFGGYLTIKEIDRVTNPGQVKIRFEEEVALQNTMGGLGIPQVGATFRVGFMPSAVRVTLKIKDSKSEELRTIVRTFQVGG